MNEQAQQETMTDNIILCNDVVRLFHSHFNEVLDILSSRFPHTKGDNSINEKEFNGLRSKVLRSGNNKIRMLPEILADYQVVKTTDTVVEKMILIKTPVIMPGEGPADGKETETKDKE
jgi:hypothetical protein